MDILQELTNRRTLALTDGIDQEQAINLRHGLLKLELESPKKEIRLLIDSDGGHTRPALYVYDVIASLEAPVTGIVVGKCHSMATVILQACTKRLALEHAMFLPHFVSTTFVFSQRFPKKQILKLIERRYLEGRVVQRECERLLAARSGKSLKDVRKLMRDGDDFGAQLSAREAQRVGLIDGIIRDSKGLFKRP